MIHEERWERALDQLITAAADTAEFVSGRAIGRSRQASIRRLAAAVDQVRAIEAEATGGPRTNSRLRTIIELTADTP